MKLANLVGDRYKERPVECVLESHALMVRGGYIKAVANGIFSSYPILKRITRKIEQIIREEMDAIDGQEVSFPVVMPASLWEESGRYESVGREMARFEDRNETPMVLGMTHEEPAVQLVREYGQTYAKYPFMIYQIQTKFRDEARPRGGLIRTREFVMKDGYSYHTSQEDLDKYYSRAYQAYKNICRRAGIPDIAVVASDSGMMGGDVSHEFMYLTPAGEDSIVICKSCDYSANMEAADCIVVNIPSVTTEPLTKVHTPNYKTIEEVTSFLKLDIKKSCKAVVYQVLYTGKYVVLFTRGDLEACETKITKYLGEDIQPATIDENSGLVAGFLGPAGLTQAQILFDNSLKGTNNLCCGANEIDYHFTGFQIERDYGDVEYFDFSKAFEGGICPKCNETKLTVSRGIEVGNIFQLGDKYTKSMNMRYSDEQGELHHPVMGCYGIGVQRLAASVCEKYHDEKGPIWPISIAPWQIHLCCLRSDDAEAKGFADKLYDDLLKNKIETIYDDRQVSVGVMFSDADLVGVPIRVVVSPRNMKENCCEITTRDKSVNEKIEPDKVMDFIKDLISRLSLLK